MTAKNYTVRTRDVDGSSARHFATLPAAVRRFEEMAGITVANAIAEAFHALADAGKPLPAIEAVQSLRAVSMFGTVVILEAVSPEAIAKAAETRAATAAAAAATAAQAALDWAGVVEYPTYGSRDERTGSRRHVLVGPFATEAEAGAALDAELGADGHDPEATYYVARVSDGLRRKAVAPLACDLSEDIPF
jgi:hypothetical protein